MPPSLPDCLHQRLSAQSYHSVTMCKAAPSGNPPTIGQNGGVRVQAIDSLHLAFSGGSALAIICGLLFFCYLRRNKCRNPIIPAQPSSAPTFSPSAPVLPSLMLPPQGSAINPPTAHLPPQPSLLQQQIRMYFESEIARAIPGTSPSAPQQQREEFEIA